MIKLTIFGLPLNPKDPRALAAFTMIGLYVLNAVMDCTGSGGGTPGVLLFHHHRMERGSAQRRASRGRGDRSGHILATKSVRFSQSYGLRIGGSDSATITLNDVPIAPHLYTQSVPQSFLLDDRADI